MIKEKLVMIAILYFFYTQTQIYSLEKKRHDYEFYFTPTWIMLDEPYYSHLFDDTCWILVGTFTIRMKNPTHLSSLTLKWRGPELTQIHCASLYKASKKNFKATTDDWMCDGQWYHDQDGQKLIFDLQQSEKLHVSTTLYLVLTLTQGSEKALTQGTFEILPDNLPWTLQKALKNSPLYLTFAPNISSTVPQIT